MIVVHRVPPTGYWLHWMPGSGTLVPVLGNPGVFYRMSIWQEIGSTSFWTHYWFYWLLFVLVSWLLMEILSLIDGHITGQKHVQVWTLSDTIRRWSFAHRWIGPFAVGTFAMLGYHFFVQANLQ